MTAWDPSNKHSSITLSNANLTAVGGGAVAIVYADTGFSATATQDKSFVLTHDAASWGSTDIGVVKAGFALGSRPNDFDATGCQAIQLHFNDGQVIDTGFTVLVSLSGGSAIGVGDQIEIRIKNGKAYFRRKPSGGSWGVYNGTTGTYSNADPSTDTGGIPLSGGLGSATVYPYAYLETDTLTGDFALWTAGTTANGVVAQTPVLGSPTASSAAPSAPNGVVTQSRVLGTPMAWTTVAGATFGVVSQPRLLGVPVLASATYQLAVPTGVASQNRVLGAAAVNQGLAAVGVVSQVPVLGSPTPTATPAATFDPAWASGSWVLSNGNLTGTKTAGGTDFLRATISQPRSVATAKSFSITVTNNDSIYNVGSSTVQIGITGTPSNTAAEFGNPNTAGMSHTGRLFSASGFNAPYYDLGRPLSGDVFTVTVQNNQMSFVKNGGAPYVIPLTDWTVTNAFPQVVAVEPDATVTGNFAAWGNAATQAGTYGVVTQSPVWGAPTFAATGGVSAVGLVSQSRVLGTSVVSAFQSPVPSWVLTDEAGGPVIDETGSPVTDETFTAGGMAGLGVIIQTPVLGGPTATQLAAGNTAFAGVGLVTQSPVLGIPGASAAATLVLGVGVVSQTPVLGSGSAAALYPLGVPTGVVPQDPAHGNPAVTIPNMSVGGITVVSQSRVLGVPTWAQNQLMPAGLLVTSQSRVLGVGTLGGLQFLAAQGVAAQMRTFGAPTAHQSYALGSPVPLVSGNAILGTNGYPPWMAQKHSLASAGGLTAQTPILGTSAARNNHNPFTGAAGVVSLNAVLGAASAIHQRHILGAVPLVSANAVVSVAAWLQNHRVTGVPLVGGVTTLPSPAMGQVIRPVFIPVVPPAPVEATPVLRQYQMLTGGGVVTQNVTLLTQPLHQRHNVAGVPEVAGAAVVPISPWGQYHQLQATGFAAQTPILLRPILHSLHMFVGIGFQSGNARLGLVAIRWTGVVGGNDDDEIRPEFSGGPTGSNFSGGARRASFVGKQRVGGMQ